MPRHPSFLLKIKIKQPYSTFLSLSLSLFFTLSPSFSLSLSLSAYLSLSPSLFLYLFLTLPPSLFLSFSLPTCFSLSPSLFLIISLWPVRERKRERGRKSCMHAQAESAGFIEIDVYYDLYSGLACSKRSSFSQHHRSARVIIILIMGRLHWRLIWFVSETVGNSDTSLYLPWPPERHNTDRVISIGQSKYIWCDIAGIMVCDLALNFANVYSALACL